jgi:Protein of unknown function (DUF2905)
MNRQLGGTIVLLGLGVAVVGLLVMTGGLSWFGRLPGDIRVVRPNVRIYVPITSMVIVSVVLSVVTWVVRRFF